ncbi:MAG TPA: DinB family protein [Vicinamibacterales bacterium]|nr:DinB family protein [Vicinamibacterales bacterium]
MRAFIEPMSDDDLTRVLQYRLLSGVEAASPIWQMVQHVVNHASYHRGQVTTMLRQAGAKPPRSMDLIAFYRERA